MRGKTRTRIDYMPIFDADSKYLTFTEIRPVSATSPF